MNGFCDFLKRNHRSKVIFLSNSRTAASDGAIHRGSVVGTTYERSRIVRGRSNLTRWIYLLIVDHSRSGSWIILPLSLLKLCALCICSQSFPDIQRRLNPFNILLSLSCQTFLTSLELGHLFASIRSLGNLPLWGQIFWQIFTTTANGAKNRLKIILLLIMIIDY